MSEKSHSNSSSSIPIHYNQPRVGGLSAQPSPASSLDNLLLDGGSMHTCTCVWNSSVPRVPPGMGPRSRASVRQWRSFASFVPVRVLDTDSQWKPGAPTFTLKSAGFYSQYVFECILTPIHSDTRQIHVSPNDTHVSLVYAARMCVSFCIVGGWRCIHVLYICIVCIYIVS